MSIKDYKLCSAEKVNERRGRKDGERPGEEYIR